jgi:Tfp pilus assembly protein PilX
MVHDLTSTAAQIGADRERGAAIIIALMVSLVLAFLGLGLLLQTSLGLQAAGTDRWVVRALYAADAGTQAEIITLASGAAGMGNFVLTDDPNLPGMMAGQYNVAVTDVCELQPPSDAIDPATGTSWDTSFRARHFYFRSAATRDAGLLVGLTQAAITQDVTIMPIPVDLIFPSTSCY